MTIECACYELAADGRTYLNTITDASGCVRQRQLRARQWRIRELLADLFSSLSHLHATAAYALRGSIRIP